MHIMEGFLPPKHAILWSLVSFPIVGLGLYSIKKQIKEHPQHIMLLGVVSAFTFVLSALKMPSITGSCSHPTGTGLGAIIFGALPMAPIGFVVLLFQALLLAHGGITTLGANIFSMAIVGPFVAVGVFNISKKIGLHLGISVFLAAALADLFTYITTSIQLAIAFPDPTSGFLGSFAKFATIFAITQIPLAISEGILTVLIFNFLKKYNTNELINLRILKPKEIIA